MKEIINTLQSYQAIQEIGMAKVFDHNFNGFGRPGNSSTCRIHIFEHNEYKLVVFQDLGKGTSVTNASEQLATEIGRLENLDPEKTIWLECYPYYGGDYDIDQIKYTYSLVDAEYSDPEWKPLKNKVIVDFLRRTIPA